MKTKNLATFYAILAAALYAINIPVSKLLLQWTAPTMMAATVLLVKDTVSLQHTHEHTHTHTHEHTHGSLIHTHEHTHVHTHTHTHGTDESVHVHTHEREDDHDHIHGDVAPQDGPCYNGCR